MGDRFRSMRWNFDPLVASGDVLYDLAFLLTDIVERDLGLIANMVMNSYLAAMQRDDDLDALAALPLFMSMRAAIRAKVTGARLAYVKDAERTKLAVTAKSYFRLALELIAPPPPALVAIGGLSGTGKSVLARALAPEFAPRPGAIVLRSDVEQKALFGISETDRLPEDAYSVEATRRTYEVLVRKARRTIMAGHSAIVDAVFGERQQREAIEAVANAAHVPFQGIFLRVDLGTRVARIRARTNDASDADIAVAERQERYDLGAMNWTVVDAAGNPAQTLTRTRSAVSERLVRT